VSRTRIAAIAGVALLASGVALLGEQAWLGAKAALAEALIDRALDRHLEDGRPHRPWSWADTWPMARLECPRLGLARPVLAGSSGGSLAFGLGHLDGTAPPNGRGNCVVAGHRDTWARFLGSLREGDVLRLRSHGETVDYTVDAVAVVHESEAWVSEPTEARRLTLVTCYPFSGLLGSPWRFVAVARAT
jgi:sortase A